MFFCFFNIFLFILIFCFTISSCSSSDEVVEVPGDTTSATVWKGENKIFTKEDGADHNQSANQDRITPSVWITRASGGGQIFSIGKTKGKLVDKANIKVTFKDVAGLEGAKEEISEIVDFLHPSLAKSLLLGSNGGRDGAPKWLRKHFLSD